MALLRLLFERRVPPIKRRILAAFLAPPLAMVLYGLVTPIWFGGGTMEQFVGMAVIAVGFGSLIGYLGMILVGLPANIALKALKAERGILYLVIGAVSLPLVLAYRDPSMPTVGQLTLVATPGGLVAGLWWLISTRK